VKLVRQMGYALGQIVTKVMDINTLVGDRCRSGRAEFRRGQRQFRCQSDGSSDAAERRDGGTGQRRRRSDETTDRPPRRIDQRVQTCGNLEGRRGTSRAPFACIRAQRDKWAEVRAPSGVIEGQCPCHRSRCFRRLRRMPTGVGSRSILCAARARSHHAPVGMEPALWTA